MTIVYVCYTCQQWNKDNIGMPNFQFKEAKIADSLTLAYEHIKQGHDVMTEVRNYEDNEE